MGRRISNERCFWIGMERPEEFPWSNHNAFLFASGREALVVLLRSLQFKEGDAVLLPAFVPEGIIAPCQLQKLDIHYYTIDRNLDPNWSCLDDMMRVFQPKLAILIHYFGDRRDAERFVAICHRYGALVIEDLAHAQTLKDSSLGANGDFVLYSLTKMVGVPDGAVLQIASDSGLQLKLKRSFDPRRTIYIAMNMGHLFLNSASRYVGAEAFWCYFWKLFGHFFGSYRFLMWYYKHPKPISFLSKLLLARFPWRSAVIKRLRHEQQYRIGLNNTVFKHLCRVEEGHCAMGYAVLVEERESLFTYLALHGIYGIWFENKWDHFPSDVIYDDARWVMQHHFLFPTAYSLSDDEVKRVIHLANAWAMTPKVTLC